MKRLQVKIDNNWNYVFCRNELKRLPIVTDSKAKAIRGDQKSIKYFSRYFSNLEFRIIS